MDDCEDGTAPALFVLASESCVTPTSFSRGPWSLDWLHGGPIAALLAHAIENVASDGVDWFVSRLTVELDRPVPVEPIRWAAHITRAGRKVSTVEATLTNADGGVVLARARALRIRTEPVALPFSDRNLGPFLDIELAASTPDDGRAIELDSDAPVAFHSHAIEQRFVGDLGCAGPIFDWVRARVPLLPGHALTPLQRIASAADQASGISAVLPGATHSFINPDLTVHLFRPLDGEWVGLASATHHGTGGTGMTNTAIFAVDGRVGNSNQSLLLNAR